MGVMSWKENEGVNPRRSVRFGAHNGIFSLDIAPCPERCHVCVDQTLVGKSFFHVLQHWSVQPCVRPFNAVHMTAGHNALRGSQVHMKISAFKECYGTMWVVLIAGSTGSALRAVRPPNLHVAPVVRRDFVHRASARGFLYRSPLAIMARTIRAILLASAIAATLVRPPCQEKP